MQLFPKLTVVLTMWLLAQVVQAQTELPPVYSVDGPVYAMESNGDTLIVGGRFTHVGKYTGGGALFTTTSDEPILTFPKINGNITASCPDGNGGFYVYGSYYRESEMASQAKARIEHILTDNTFEAGFSLDVSAFGVTKMLFNNGLLYVGGWNITQIASQTATSLNVINVTTRQLQTWVPPILRTNSMPVISNFMIARGTLYIVGDFTSVGGQPRSNAAAIAIGSGLVRPWNPSSTLNGGYSDLLRYGSNIVIGGGFHDGTFTQHAGALIDSTNGTLIKYLFTSNGALFGNNGGALYFATGVNSLAIKDDILFAYSSGTFDTRVTAIDLRLSLPTSSTAPSNVLWMKYFNGIANAKNMAVIGNSLYLAGDNFSDVYATNATNATANFERKVRNIVRLNTSTGNLENWFPDPVSSGFQTVWTLSVSGTNLFFGGVFSHMKGQDRNGLVMIRNSIQTVLPFSLNDDYIGFTDIRALKQTGDTLYVGGSLVNLVGQYSSIAGYRLPTSTRIATTTISLGNLQAIEVSNRHVFVGGSLYEPAGGAGRTHLFAIDRQTGNLTTWAPNPDRGVIALHSRNGKLYVGGDFRNISGQTRRHLVAYDLSTLNLTAWNPDPDWIVNTISSVYGTIWAGGFFSAVGSVPRYLAASVSEQTGAVNSFPTFSFLVGSAYSLVPAGRYMLIAGGFQLRNTAPCNNLTIYDMYAKAPVSTTGTAGFCQIVDGILYTSAKIGNDWYFGGNFTKLNGKTIATNIGRVRFPVDYFNDPDEYVTVRTGNWYDPTTWQVELVPPVPTNVTINHRINLPIPTISRRVRFGVGGIVQFGSGASLKIGQ